MGDRSIDQVVSDVWRVVDKLLAAMADDELRARMERRLASAYPGNERAGRVKWSRGNARKDFNLARARARMRRRAPAPGVTGMPAGRVGSHADRRGCRGAI